GERLAPHGTVGCKVGTGDVPVTARHLGCDELRGTPGVESVRTRGGDPPQRRFELCLGERRIGGECGEVSEEVGAPMELGAELVAPRAEQSIDTKAVMGVANRGCEIGAPGEAGEAAMQLPQARDRPRNAGGAGTDGTRVRDDLTGRIEVHA